MEVQFLRAGVEGKWKIHLPRIFQKHFSPGGSHRIFYGILQPAGILWVRTVSLSFKKAAVRPRDFHAPPAGTDASRSQVSDL